jgi:hypothetical protein
MMYIYIFMKVYNFIYNNKIHYLIPTCHIDYSLLNSDIINFIIKLTNKVDKCAFEINSEKMMKSIIPISSQVKKDNPIQIKDIYNKSDIMKMKQHYNTTFMTDIPTTFIDKQHIISILAPLDIITKYKNTNLSNIKSKYIDIHIESILPKKKCMALDSIKTNRPFLQKEYHEHILNMLVKDPPNISVVQRNITNFKVIKNQYESLFKHNQSMNLKKVNYSDEMIEQCHYRNIQWIKKIKIYLDKNPNKTLAICVGALHIFGANDIDHKIGNTLPNLLSKINGVSDIMYNNII